MSTNYDSPPPSFYEPPEFRFVCMECGTGVTDSLAEIEDDEVTCPECGSTDIDLASRYDRLLLNWKR